MLYRLTIDIDGKDDALALAQLIREMGYSVSTYAHQPNHKRIAETRAGQLVLSQMVPGRSYTANCIAPALTEAGYAASTTATVLSLLTKQGDLKRIGTGLYSLPKTTSL